MPSIAPAPCGPLAKRVTARQEARRRAGCGGGLRERDGSAEQRAWRGQVRPEGPGRRPLESARPSSFTNTRSPRRKATWSRAARSAPRPASTPAARRRTSSSSATTPPRRRSGGRRTASSRRSSSTCCSTISSSTRKRQAAVRAGPLWRRRSEIPHQGARVHRTRVAFDVHPLAADPARSQGACRATFRISPSSACRPSRPIRRSTACARETVIALNFTKRMILIGG